MVVRKKAAPGPAKGGKAVAKIIDFANVKDRGNFNPKNIEPGEYVGKITKVVQENPHGWIYIDVKGDDGKVVNWAFETAAANALYRRGTRPEDFPVGTQVTIDGYVARNGTPTATSGKLMFADGRAITIGAGAVAGESK